MIEQYLSQTNENTTVQKSKIFRELNKTLVRLKNVCLVTCFMLRAYDHDCWPYSVGLASLEQLNWVSRLWPAASGRFCHRPVSSPRAPSPAAKEGAGSINKLLQPCPKEPPRTTLRRSFFLPPPRGRAFSLHLL